ncbi:MAG: WYL domain-containing transcriptional regulator [Clostridia bacterium]|nr:WYL domain-containing transcriptional regulator [Clostridia bacterium]
MDHDNKTRTWQVLRILQTESDEAHPLSLADIDRALQERSGIKAHRITLTKDIELLQECGIDIVTVRSTQNRYFIGQRLFEMPELHLLADAISSSRCLTPKKSEELIAKLTSLMSRHQATALQNRPTAVADGKPKNEQIYYIMDAIRRAIDTKQVIRFEYFDYTPSKERVLRGNGEVYTLSPYACMWSGDYYYVIGWSDKRQDMTVFRVDRIAATPTVGPEAAVAPPTDFDVGAYSNSVFQMYRGERVDVTLQCDNDLMKAIIDRFGEDVQTDVCDEHTFSVTAEVSLSPTFYAWVFEFGGKVRIVSPDKAVNTYKDQILSAARSFL